MFRGLCQTVPLILKSLRPALGVKKNIFAQSFGNLSYRLSHIHDLSDAPPDSFFNELKLASEEPNQLVVQKFIEDTVKS